MSVYWLFVESFFLGFRHALAVDHVAAVTTFIANSRANAIRSLKYSLQIGLGHAGGMCGVAIVGLFAVHQTIMDSWGTWLSRVTGVWLIIFSAWMLVDVIYSIWHNRKTLSEGLIAKERGNHRAPSAVEKTKPFFASPARWSRHKAAPWLIGLLFGLAVSPGDLAILAIVFGQSSNLGFGITLLLVFLLAMLLGLAALGILLASIRTQRRLPVQRWLTSATSAFGLVIGVLLVGGWLS